VTLRNLVRTLGIAAKRAAPPGTRRYRVVQRLSRLLPDSLRGNYEDNPIAERLHGFAQRRGAVFFVQVGSHDAQAGDPISLYVKRDGWRGILVEPVPEIFARLRAFYGDLPGLSFENVAIAERDGTMPLYRLSPAAGEIYELADSLGSLDRDTLMSHAEQVPGIDRYVEQIEVPCRTFASLLERHGPERIDLLHIDAEGYDARLLRTFPWQRFTPELVLYEHDHLDAGERATTERMLRERGYRLYRSRTNTLGERDTS
jgi:FkbM family methyltransferase